MSQREPDEADRSDLPDRPATEGVRIIGAEEAEAALRTGKATGRLSPQASLAKAGVAPGARPVHRFPGSGSTDSGEAGDLSGKEITVVANKGTRPVPQVTDVSGSVGAQEAGATDTVDTGARSVAGGGGEPPTGIGVDPAGRTEMAEMAEMSRPVEAGPSPAAGSAGTAPTEPVTTGQEGGSGGDDEFPDGVRDVGGDDESLQPGVDELAAWSSLPRREPIEPPGVVEDDKGFPFAGDGPTAQPRSRGPRTAAGARLDERLTTEPETSTSAVRRLATGIAVAAVGLTAFSLGPAAVMVLAAAVIGVAAVELFDVLRKAGYRPATLLGLVATVSLLGAAYWRGEQALPLVAVLTLAFAMLWYLAGVVAARPTTNVAVTLFGFSWVGLLGSYAALLLRAPDGDGTGLLMGAVLTTVAYDVGGFVVGSRWGRRRLAAGVSPNKTWEGLVGGWGLILFVSLVLVSQIGPWSLTHSLALALVVAAVAPLGDLCESMFKRDLGIKDTGSLLPGHGGVLDRFDTLLFALPAVFYLARSLGLA